MEKITSNTDELAGASTMQNINAESANEITTVAQAECMIGFLLQEMNLMGANDMEFPETSKVLGELKAGNISPQEAVRTVRELKNRKVDHLYR